MEISVCVENEKTGTKSDAETSGRFGTTVSGRFCIKDCRKVIADSGKSDVAGSNRFGMTKLGKFSTAGSDKFCMTGCRGSVINLERFRMTKSDKFYTTYLRRFGSVRPGRYTSA